MLRGIATLLLHDRSRVRTVSIEACWRLLVVWDAYLRGLLLEVSQTIGIKFCFIGEEFFVSWPGFFLK